MKQGREKAVDLEKIKMLVLDVDGVMTDGNIVVNADGSETKSFCVQDGHGIRMWRRAGLKVALLSGRLSPPTAHRAEQIEADHCVQDCHDKLAGLKELLQEAGMSADEVVYVGDDLPDFPPMCQAGLGVAVANAVEELKEHADFITARRGGEGAVREVIEYVLKATGQWQELMKRYLP